MAIHLTMDFGVVVLFRHNRATRRQACIWAHGPSVERMRRQAARYVGRITGLDLDAVDWVRSALLLDAVNRPRDRRPVDGCGVEYT